MAASRPASSNHVRLIVVMGVSGSGKTSVGERLAARYGVRFVEGDALHPRRNVEKMAAGIPLEDEDRWPWLDRLGAELAAARRKGVGLIVSCSSLKKAYRDRLRQAAGGGLTFVFLQGTPELLRARLAGRLGHFMPASLLDSQLAALQDPSGEEGVIPVDIALSPGEIVKTVNRELAR